MVINGIIGKDNKIHILKDLLDRRSWKYGRSLCGYCGITESTEEKATCQECYQIFYAHEKVK